MRFGMVMRGLAAGALASCVVVTSCTVDDDLDDRLWPCDVQAELDECGTKDGRPMTCWQGYCLRSCDPNDPPSEGAECLSVGVRLEKCHPSLDDCPGALNCYRRDLLYDEGVCVPFPVCEFNSECEGESRSVCAGQVLREHVGDSKAFYSDHFQCVEDRCSEGGCSEGQMCLDDAYRVE